MCNIALALAAASFGLQTYSQYQQANAQADLAEAQFDAAEKAYRFESNQLEQHRAEERRTAAQRAFDTQQEAVALRSSALVSAGEAGVTGLSVTALLQDLKVQEGIIDGRQKAELRTSFSDLASRGQANYIDFQNTTKGVATPSRGAFLLGVGNSAINSAGIYADLGGSFPDLNRKSTKK